ncbi:MAG: hypothetical protein Q8O93_00690 [bacterium]|nr:hypothetical protein [bacterium]
MENIFSQTETFKKNAKKSIKHTADRLQTLAEQAKRKYDQTDEKTKKKIVAGLAGAAVLIAVAIGAKKAASKNKK